MLGYSSSQSAEDPEPSSQVEVVASQEDAGSCQNEVEVLEPGPTEMENIIEPEKSVEVEVQVEAVVEQVAASLPPPLLCQASSGTSYTESSSFSATENAAKSFSSTPGYLANRWNAFNSSFSTPSSSQVPTFATPPM